MCDLMDHLERKKLSRKRQDMMKLVLRELAMDSNSYIPGGDDFVAGSSNGDMSDELVP